MEEVKDQGCNDYRNVHTVRKDRCIYCGKAKIEIDQAEAARLAAVNAAWEADMRANEAYAG
jgi:hypothetical protein